MCWRRLSEAEREVCTVLPLDQKEPANRNHVGAYGNHPGSSCFVPGNSLDQAAALVTKVFNEIDQATVSSSVLTGYMPGEAFLT